MQGLNEFLRKYKWHHVLSGRPVSGKTANRFAVSSNREPPSALVPRHVLEKCMLIKDVVSANLRSCKSCFSRDNLSTRERLALSKLTDEACDFFVSPVDKGGGWIVVSRDDYCNEAYRQLCDENFYTPREDSLVRSTALKLTQLLNHLYRNHFINLRELRTLSPPEEPRDRCFYLLPKVHKSVWPSPTMPPGRPIISDVDSVSRKCASFIEYFLSPIARNLDSFVRDSMHVISIVRDFSLPDNAILFSLDVTSLYTNIPHEAGIAACGRAFIRFPDERRPDLTVLSMLRLLLNSNDFMFRHERFQQTHGTMMGGAFGGSYGSIFLGEWEERALSLDKHPVLWLRFIDDILGVWTYDEASLLNFVHIVNSFNVNISVTLSYDRFSIRFLDLELYRDGNRLCYRTGFKPTDSFKVLNPDSYHAPHVFNSVIFGQLYRFATHSSSYGDFIRSKNLVQSRWRTHGYSRTFIRNSARRVLEYTGQTPLLWETGFYPCSTCNLCTYGFFCHSVRDGPNSFPIVHRISCSDTSIIYLIVCKRCSIRYVGETSRSLRSRISEHVYNILRSIPTSVSQHFNSSCSLADFSFTALERSTNTTRRRKKETRWMRRLNTLAPRGLNQQCASRKAVHFVLPYSACSNRVVRVCQSIASDVTTVGSFTSSRNLRSLFSAKRF